MYGVRKPEVVFALERLEAKKEERMDIGVVIALSVFGLGGLLAVLMGIIAAISAVTGINITSAPHQEED